MSHQNDDIKCGNQSYLPFKNIQNQYTKKEIKMLKRMINKKILNNLFMSLASIVLISICSGCKSAYEIQEKIEPVNVKDMNELANCSEGIYILLNDPMSLMEEDENAVSYLAKADEDGHILELYELDVNYEMLISNCEETEMIVCTDNYMTVFDGEKVNHFSSSEYRKENYLFHIEYNPASVEISSEYYFEKDGQIGFLGQINMHELKGNHFSLVPTGIIYLGFNTKV